MKTNGRIRELLQTACTTDYQYSYRVVEPFLEYLGIPRDMCWPQFRIKDPFGSGLLRLERTSVIRSGGFQPPSERRLEAAATLT